jgi:hypothetical protein
MTDSLTNSSTNPLYNKKETMEKRDLARLLDYYRIRVGKKSKLLNKNI